MMKQTLHRITNALTLSAALVAGAVLTGCAIHSASAPVAVQGSMIKGRVMGGQQPVAFGSVQLWATSATGYGTQSTALISTSTTTVGTTTPVTTDSGGNFVITGDFTCPTTATTPVYLTITGGNPGNGGGVVNNNLALMAALGPCNNLTNIPYVNVNELTTVASVWALAPFMTALDHIGTSSTNAPGLANAFAAVNKVVNIGSGAVGGPALPSGATLPVDEINGLADILSVCVNSIGGTDNDGSGCGTLFHNAKPGSTAPTDTITAAMNIAQNPALNVVALYGLIPGTGAVFSTSLTQPNAWTIAINYTGGGLKSPQSVATDASGNVWSANAGNSSVTKLSSTGAAISGTSGFTAGSIYQPTYVATDASGNAWVANANNSGTPSITKLSSDGSSGTQITGNGLSTPKSISFDSLGNAWVANSGTSSNSVSAFTSTGTAIANHTGGGITAPVGIAVNPQ